VKTLRRSSLIPHIMFQMRVAVNVADIWLIAQQRPSNGCETQRGEKCLT
jgi:hypothetical protein